MKAVLTVFGSALVFLVVACGDGTNKTMSSTHARSTAALAADSFVAEDGGPGPNQAAPGAPSQSSGSKALRAHLRGEGRRAGAAWADDIDEDETTLAREGRAASVTVNGTPDQADLREVCETAKSFETRPAFVTVSDWDGSLSEDC